MTTYWLSTHVGYACRHSGACCSARWPIPVERDRVDSLRLAASQWLTPADPDAPPEIAGVLAFGPTGACVFHAPRVGARGGCLVHAARPASCAHFPYVCVIDPRGVHVTLSHYCPTAAAMLFSAGGSPRKVAGPVVPVASGEPEGLDARAALPPIDPSSHAGTRPRAQARRIARGTTPARSTPRLLAWDEVTEWESRAIDAAVAVAGDRPQPDAQLFDRARATVAAGLAWPVAPDDLLPAWHRFVAPEWQRWRAPIGAYLAAKVHAAWAMHLGDGLAAVQRQVHVARAVLQVEAVRQCLETGAPLDQPCLLAAIRQADLLLVHYADPARLSHL